MSPGFECTPGLPPDAEVGVRALVASQVTRLLAGGMILYALVLTGCGSGEKEDTKRDTGSTCPDLDDLSCPDSHLYVCDDCGEVYRCDRHDGTNLTWAWSSWPCECVGDSGQLLIWDSGSQTGNPACVYTY